MPEPKALYSQLHNVAVKHMKRKDVPAKRALRDMLVTMRQLAENHKISFSDIAMDASERYARLSGAK
jgi:hypothetical protein